MFNRSNENQDHLFSEFVNQFSLHPVDFRHQFEKKNRKPENETVFLIFIFARRFNGKMMVQTRRWTCLSKMVHKLPSFSSSLRVETEQNSEHVMILMTTKKKKKSAMKVATTTMKTMKVTTTTIKVTRRRIQGK